jgi:uncharacterized protein (DUF433 family)
MTVSQMPHVVLDERGRAWIDDTNIKVVEVVLDRTAFGWTPEEIEKQHDGYLSLAQVYAALAYYHDHKADLDAEIERDYQAAEKLRNQNLDSPVRQKLRALGKIP